VDAAGNIVAKQNYTWYFKYQTKILEQTGQITRQSKYVAASMWHP
jgi:hypothetical protein